MWDLAYAQSSQSSGGMFESLGMLPPMILIFGVFYFLLIRPQQKKAREHKEMLGQLKRNDEVMTTGGVLGKVTALNETELTLEVASNVRIRVSRGHIAQVFRAEKVAPKEVKAKS